METPSSKLVEIIQSQKDKETSVDIWITSDYKLISQLESNNVGNVGENFIHLICENQGIESSIDGSKTKQKGGGEIGDGKINGKTVEIKTARLGASEASFQHELGEQPWKSNYMAFVDIMPLYIYLTIFPNFTETHYKSGAKCEPYFPSKKVTWRKQKGAFKLDTSPCINENLLHTFSIKITKATTFQEIGSFIRRIIV